ncbi:transmembrane protein 256 homolog [Ornithodoros turicata]|uniref:transmembrane protein 256 homolog n=1 Tax=Ornithodoros turicata TaxID=34597 RepID=UPI00313A33B5
MNILGYVSGAVTDNFITKGIVGTFRGSNGKHTAASAPVPGALPEPVVKRLVRCGGAFVRIAGFSGAAAVALGAYGAHVLFKRDDIPEERKEAYDIANHYHLLHTLALLCVPLTRRPKVVGALLTTGMALFCGSCYAYGLTGYPAVKNVAPYGGSVLILAWLSMLL